MEDGGNLNKFRVGPRPTLFYIPDFITDYQQTQLLNNVPTSFFVDCKTSFIFLYEISPLLAGFPFCFIDLPSSSVQVEIFEE